MGGVLSLGCDLPVPLKSAYDRGLLQRGGLLHPGHATTSTCLRRQKDTNALLP